MSRNLTGLIGLFLALATPAVAAVMDGQTVQAWHYHGSQPDSGTSAFATFVVGEGVELTEFGVHVWENGQPLPGMYDIDFSDTTLVITATHDQAFGYWDALIFTDVNGTIPDILDITINPETDWAEFTDSDIYIDNDLDYINLNVGGGDALEGQMISLEIVVDLPPPPCEGDANGDNTVDPLDAGFVLARLGCEVGAGDSDCDAADVNVDAVVNPLDVGFVLARFGPCPE